MTSSLFGMPVQMLKLDSDKSAVMRTLEKAGCPYGTRVHTNLTEAHNAILSRHVFYVAGRKRSPSWWLVLCKNGSNCLNVLVEPTKKPEFPYPRMYLWPGRWDPQLYNGSVFVVQCPNMAGPAGEAPIVLEDTMMCPIETISWTDSTFSARWKVTQQVFYELFRNDETINPIEIQLRDYLPLASFKSVVESAPFIEFMPEDAGRRRFLLIGKGTDVPVVHAVPPMQVKSQAKPVTTDPTKPTLDMFRTNKQAIYGVKQDKHPDVYTLYAKLPTTKIPQQLKNPDETPINAIVQSLATSLSLHRAFETVPADGILVWKCRWIGAFSKWEPYEQLPGTWNDNLSKISTM